MIGFFAVLVLQAGLVLALLRAGREAERAWAIERARLLNLVLASGEPRDFVALQRASAVPAAEPERVEHPFVRKAVVDAHLTPEGPPPLPLGL